MKKNKVSLTNLCVSQVRQNKTNSKGDSQYAVCVLYESYRGQFHDRSALAETLCRVCRQVKLLSIHLFSVIYAILRKRIFIIVPCRIWRLLPSFPQVEALKLIYSQILEQHVTDPREKFHPAVQKFTGPLINTALYLHDKIAATFLPTVVKFHYLFNLRDLTNIFQVRNARGKDFVHQHVIFF